MNALSSIYHSVAAFVAANPEIYLAAVPVYLAAWQRSLDAASKALAKRGYTKLADAAHALALRPAPMSKAAALSDASDAAVIAISGSKPAP